MSKWLEGIHPWRQRGGHNPGEPRREPPVIRAPRCGRRAPAAGPAAAQRHPAILAPFAGRACDRPGSRQFLVSGSLLLALGSCLLDYSPGTSRPGELILDMIVLGAVLGFFTPANNCATMAAKPREKLAPDGGLLNMMRSLGVILGVDISGWMFVAVGSARAASPGGLGKRLPFPAKRPSWAVCTRSW